MSDSETTAPAANKDEVTRLRPTLIVALGGTGKEVALRLRRRILQNDWNGNRITDLARFPVASFVYFDTDTTQATETDRAQRFDPLAAAVAFRDTERLQKAIDVGHYMRELDNYPHIKEWLPEAELSQINTDKGAGQVRAISRLLLFDQYATLKQMIRTQGGSVLNTVSLQPELEYLSLDLDRQSLRVVVIASAAGGTGSGSFIDVGLMIRALRTPQPAQVDLVLLLPGGFRGAGSQRVNANAFATLMELEHVMRPGSIPRYVDRWTTIADDKPEEGVPYNDVYLIDSRNLAGEATDQVSHLYDMIADVLFEDFGSSEFANRKRSVSVNQRQYKLDNYTPPLSARFGQEALSYSLAYSSFGQAMIVTKGQVALDTAAAEACQTMVKTFFNVATEDSARLPTPDERSSFLDSVFHLGRTSFEEKLDGLADNDAINEPEIVDVLLQRENGTSVAAGLEDQIHGDFHNEILGPSGDVTNWMKLALQIFERRRADVWGTIADRDKVGLAGRQVVLARQQLVRRLKAQGDGGLRVILFGYLDNRARGGLDYAIKLVEDSKIRMEEDIAFLRTAATRYKDRAESVRERFNRSLENLRMAAQNRLFRGPDRKAAERYLDHLRDETAFYVKLLLRQLACTEAIEFLEEMSTYLGTQRGIDAKGRVIWEGAIAELVRGRDLVEQVVSDFDQEVRLLQDAVSRQNAGTYVVLQDADAEAKTVMATSPAEVQQWAMEIFDAEGGSRALFPILEDDKRRATLLANLRGLARERLAPRASRLRSVTEQLALLPERQRLNIFERAMRRAMPWINASFDRTGGRLPMEDRYKLYVAVENLDTFRRFEREVRQVIPLKFNHLDLTPSGLRDRIVIYCEVSGIPLDAIIPLGEDWRRSYRIERRGPLPLHNHKSATRFANPVVPSNEEIEQIRNCMGLFVRAVCFGILEREHGRDAGYQLHIQSGDLMDVGTERDIRADGFLTTHKDEIVRRLERFERSLVPLQMLAASALLQWTSETAYAPRVVRRDNRSALRPGLTNLVLAELAKSFFERFRRMQGAEAIADPEFVRDQLAASMTQWTMEIEGSVDDLDPMDASYRSSEQPGHDEGDIRSSRNKRRIRPDRFTVEGLEQILQTTSRFGVPAVRPQVSTKPRSSEAPASPAQRWYLAINKIVSGPFTADELLIRHFEGTFVSTTNVLPEGNRRWIKANEVPVLMDVLNTEAPPSDEDDPLADPPPD